MINSILDQTLKFFFLFLPISYVIGPAIINSNLFLLLIISLIIFLSNFNLEKNIILFKKKNFIFFLAFYVYVNFLSLISDNIYFSLKSTVPLIKFLLLFLIVNYLFSKKLINLINICFVFLSVFIFIIIDSILQISFGYNFFLFEPVYGQVTGIFRDEQILGSYISRNLSIIIGCILIINFNKRYQNLAILFLLLFSFIVILFAGERTAFINFTIICLLLVVLRIIRLNLISISFIFSFLIIFILLVFNNQYINDRFIEQNFEEVKPTKFSKIPFPDHYLLHYSTAFNIFKKNLILGSGPNTFRFQCSKDEYIIRGSDFYELPPKYKYDGTLTKKQIKSNALHSRLSSLDGCSTHPHNMHIQLLSEIGIFGYLFILYFFYLVIKKYITLEDNKYLFFNKCMFIGIFVNFFPLIPSGNIFGSYFNFIIFLPVLFYFIEKNYKS